MAFLTGSRINPSLGKADLSGFTNAAKIQADALINLGEKTAKSIKDYGVNKLQFDNISSENESIILSEQGQRLFGDILENPEVPESVKKAYTATSEGRGGLPAATTINTFIRTAVNQDNSNRAITLENLEIDKLRVEEQERQRHIRERGLSQTLLSGMIKVEKQEDEDFKINNEFLGKYLQKGIASEIPIEFLDDSIATFNTLTDNRLDIDKKEREIRRDEEETPYRSRALEAETKSAELDVELKEQEIDENKLKLASLDISMLGDSIGFEEADKIIGKDYGQFVTKGFAEVENNIASLKDVIRTIAQNPDMGFRSVTSFLQDIPLGDEIVDAFNLELGDVRDRIRGIAYQSLRDTLGAQFTEREGQRLVSTYFNPRLTASQNIKRLIDFVDRLEQVKDARIGAFTYFKEKGTIKGYDPKFATSSTMAVSKLMSDYEQANRGTYAPFDMQSDGSGGITFTPMPDITDG